MQVAAKHARGPLPVRIPELRTAGLRGKGAPLTAVHNMYIRHIFIKKELWLLLVLGMR